MKTLARFAFRELVIEIAAPRSPKPQLSFP